MRLARRNGAIVQGLAPTITGVRSGPEHERAWEVDPQPFLWHTPGVHPACGRVLRTRTVGCVCLGGGGLQHRTSGVPEKFGGGRGGGPKGGRVARGRTLRSRCLTLPRPRPARRLVTPLAHDSPDLLLQFCDVPWAIGQSCISVTATCLTRHQLQGLVPWSAPAGFPAADLNSARADVDISAEYPCKCARA